MATRSRSTARPASPLDQGELGPTLPATATESSGLEPKVYGEISLGRAISLILDCKTKSSSLSGNSRKPRRQPRKPKTGWAQSIKPSLALRLGVEPHTHQKTGSLRQLRPRPGPYPKPTLFQRLAHPSLPGPTPLELPPPSHNQLPSRLPASPYSPSTFAYPPPFPQLPQPAAPVAAYPAPVKVDHPDAYTGKIGNEARQWLTRMLAWVRLNQRMFPTDQETLSFLLMNMKDTAGAWAHPHLDQLGSHRALIQSVNNFRAEFLAAFGNPDATQAAERQITHLTQTGTCAEYITRFRTIAMDLDWNDAALRGQFARGLHWEVSRLIATRERRPTTLLKLQNTALVIDNALREERASHPPKGNKSGASTTTPIGGEYRPTGHKTRAPLQRPQLCPQGGAQPPQAEGLCIKCGKAGHKFAECRTGWKATPKEEGVKKEAAKIGKESGPKSGKD
ncbi:Retrotransposon gag protein [Rhizoctonia solani]|uniref:Retrotransposon gag protein n=1 Tax=Rhizoctonia solani TaxID=456999 RepID=A0A8H7LXH7_9AGAM|nr:Retrotransposon gag protein [Rhizoctonia solani]